MMCALLRSRGLFIQRARVRRILSQVNPVAVAIRWSNSIRRRVYSVPTPNSLWHMDAHLKLARWGFVTHSCIDGYSRMITYSKCTTSITAQTVLDIFVPSIKKYGLPSRMRSDHGYENLFVAVLMNILRGLDRGSHIPGRSVHNQRVERLWRDIYTQVISTFYNEMKNMEDDGLLDINNNIHLFVLQYFYIDVINNRLDVFVEAWNRHRIRTMGRKTPRQLWLNGMLANMHSNHTATNEVFNEQFQNANERIRREFNRQEPIVHQGEVNVSRFTVILDLSEHQQAHLALIRGNEEHTVRDKYLEGVRFLSE